MIHDVYLSDITWINNFMKKNTNGNNDHVVTRFAPSPTGLLHIGAARTALFNFLYARQHGGKIILRIEDTDKVRSKKEFEEDILESLKWLKIEHDEVYRQSQRIEKGIYKKYIKKMIDEGTAYASKEKEGQSMQVIRFKNPCKEITFEDVVRGKITVDTTDLGDFIISKDEETPLYHLAVVIDDHEMGVTHLIRGEDHISNTPRQILIQEVIGASRPIYAHIPLILAPDKSKLSKRKDATTSVNEYRRKGYLAEAVVNFIALLGWSPQGTRSDPKDEEIFTLQELLKYFSLDRIQKSGAVFSIDKLNWINRQHIKRLSRGDFKKIAEEYLSYKIKKLPQYSEKRLMRIIPLLVERIEKFGDIDEMSKEGELDYLFQEPVYESKGLMWKGETNFQKTKEHIDKVINLLQEVSSKDFTADEIKNMVWEYASAEGRGVVLWPMRFALSGMQKSPDPFVLAEVFGKEETISRLQDASLKLSQQEK